MREQTRRLKALVAEYETLKAEIFPNGAKFMEVDATERYHPKAQRYNQLLLLFNPHLKYTSGMPHDWQPPLTPFLRETRIGNEKETSQGEGTR